MVRKRVATVQHSLRDDICALIHRNKVSMEKGLEAVAQCQSQLANRLLVEETAKQCRLKLSSFLTNDELELYYDIKQGRQDLGFISKGWDDPGFRIGDLLLVPRQYLPRLKDNILDLLRYCATRGVSVSIESAGGDTELQMDAVIYLDGFNAEVFEQVLHYLNVCTEKAEELMAQPSP